MIRTEVLAKHIRMFEHKVYKTRAGDDLDDIPLAVKRNNLWFMHDGGQQPFSLVVKLKHLIIFFQTDRLIKVDKKSDFHVFATRCTIS